MPTRGARVADAAGQIAVGSDFNPELIPAETPSATLAPN